MNGQSDNESVTMNQWQWISEKWKSDNGSVTMNQSVKTR